MAVGLLLLAACRPESVGSWPLAGAVAALAAVGAVAEAQAGRDCRLAARVASGVAWRSPAVGLAVAGVAARAVRSVAPGVAAAAWSASVAAMGRSPGSEFELTIGEAPFCSCFVRRHMPSGHAVYT